MFERSAVIDWSETEARTAHGTVGARQVIMATHLPLGQVGQYYAHTRPHMHAVMAARVPAGRAPAGMYIGVDEPKRSLRRHRAPEGETMLILTGPRFQHGDAAKELEGFGELEAFAREHFGYAGGGLRWTNEDYAPRDGLPYVGWSGAAGRSLLVATGFDAWGLSNGAAAARILADLCEERDNGWAALFDASRHSLKGLGKAVGAAGKVAGELVGGHPHTRPGREEPLGRGEGRLVDFGGRTAGMFRDDEGRVSAVSAVCTHMGCVLGWNPIDRSWDCPCHGSRFATDGRVLHGPAVEALEPIESNDARTKNGRE